jgi:ribosomal protein L44E
MKGAARGADQRRSKDKNRGTRTAPRHNVRGSEYIVKREIVVATCEVVNKEL